ncbi:hypothetical protein OR16_33723 [Cupriavidus basilensis OR16]|uniref:Uncharacterized protein n=1 Tax=Cupriavidus basilensis OR16 TaxID=1127483 RepID=H1SEL3_9BURK|nr:hypothetical protein OR16_33723 [Cupriavidus basilensis OR16]
MATNRPPGSNTAPRRQPQQPQQPQKSQKSQGAQRPQSLRKPHGKESTALRDLGPDTVWHTRGLHGRTRQRPSRPSSVRSPRPQLPPSRVPRLLLWGLLLVLLAVLANAVMNMTH